MQVKVDATVCTGHGRCYALAPEVFAPDEFGHCEIVAEAGAIGGVVDVSLEDQARLGRDNCPELAITIVE